MSQRERFLAIAVGVVLVLLAGQYVFNKVSATLDEKQTAIESAQSKLTQMKKQETDGGLAAKQLKTLVPKSLPKNPESLVGQYKQWLTQLGNECGMTGIQVTPPTRAAKTTSAYSAYNFTLQGVCNTDRLLDLMGLYYDRDYLQRITSLRMDGTADKNKVSVTMQSQVLALSSADPRQEASLESSGRLAMSVEEYREAILNRNPFSPPNRAPTLDVRKSYEVVRDEDWSLDLGELLKDPEGQRVSVELIEGEGLPDGLRLSGKTLRWKPTENGKFEIGLLAEDNGWPSATTERTIYVSVVDPAPVAITVEAPKFDRTKRTFLTGCVGGGVTGKQAWIRSQTDGTEFDLLEGDKFEFEGIKAKVHEINTLAQTVVFETEDRRWLLDMDTSLAEAYQNGQAD